MERLAKEIPLQNGVFKDFHICDGETIYKSKGTGFYGMQFQGFFEFQELNQLQFGFYADAFIRVKKLKNCYV